MKLTDQNSDEYDNRMPTPDDQLSPMIKARLAKIPAKKPSETKKPAAGKKK